MTKCTIIGGIPDKKKTSIEFIKAISFSLEDCSFNSNPINPNNWSNLELVARKFSNERDLIYAYPSYDRNQGMLYLGKWNDGIVE